MRHYVFLLFCLLLLSQSAAAQNCYLNLRREGQTAFDNRNYDEAIRLWDAAKDCAPAQNDLDALIAKAESAKRVQTTPSVSTPSRLDFEPETVLIPAGSFQMGSNDKDGGSDEQPMHTVRLSAFRMGKYELTVGQFKAFVEDSYYKTDAEKGDGSYIYTTTWETKAGINWRHDENGQTRTNLNHPVIHVSWNDAVAYCQWLKGKTGKNYRLPTEAEWEYACRAGTQTPFYTGANLTTDQANYDGRYPYLNFPKGQYLGKTKPVGSYSKNNWGLYDMHGNIWEWCQDWYDTAYYKNSPVENPRGTSSAQTYRVLRGSSWFLNGQYCRSAYRGYDYPDNRNSRYGFRVVCLP